MIPIGWRLSPDDARLLVVFQEPHSDEMHLAVWSLAELMAGAEPLPASSDAAGPSAALER